MKRILGIDYGDVRVGLAISDPLGITAQGLETLVINGSDKKDIFGRDLTNDGVFAKNYTFLDLTSTSISSGFVKDSTYSLFLRVFKNFLNNGKSFDSKLFTSNLKYALSEMNTKVLSLY